MPMPRSPCRPPPVDLAVITIDGPGGAHWSFLLATHDGNALAVGTYVIDPTSLTSPSAAIQGPMDDTPCSFLGSFDVIDIEHDAGSGEVTSLAARISGGCDQGVQGFSADLRYRSAIGLALMRDVDLITIGPTPATTTEDRDIAIESIGTGPLTIADVGLDPEDNPYGADITIVSETCTATPIEPGDGCIVTVRYAANHISMNTHLVLTTDAIRPERRVTVAGITGSQLVVDPISVAFGNGAIGVPSAPTTVELTNVGTTNVPLLGTQVTGTGASSYTISNDTCAATTLGAGASCSVQVRFVANGAGSRIAEIAWYKGDPSSPTFAAASSLSGTGIDPNAAFVRSGAHWAGPAYTSTDGSALARSTPPSGGAFLHAVANAHRVGSTTVKDAGPYSPVLYLRSSNGGTTWTSGTRLNPTNQHGVWPGVASYGSYVYASWVKVPKVVNWTLNGRRQIWFRSNSHGGAGSWGVAKAVTSSSSRVDFPTIAAAGANIYIAYTDADTGVVRVLVSKNRGSTWTAIKLGTSAATSDAGGHSGSPSVAVSGSTVIVAWVEQQRRVRARKDLHQRRVVVGHGHADHAHEQVLPVGGRQRRARRGRLDRCRAVRPGLGSWRLGPHAHGARCGSRLASRHLRPGPGPAGQHRRGPRVLGLHPALRQDRLGDADRELVRGVRDGWGQLVQRRAVRGCGRERPPPRHRRPVGRRVRRDDP